MAISKKNITDQIEEKLSSFEKSFHQNLGIFTKYVINQENRLLKNLDTLKGKLKKNLAKNKLLKKTKKNISKTVANQKIKAQSVIETLEVQIAHANEKLRDLTTKADHLLHISELSSKHLPFQQAFKSLKDKVSGKKETPPIAQKSKTKVIPAKTSAKSESKTKAGTAITQSTKMKTVKKPVALSKTKKVQKPVAQAGKAKMTEKIAKPSAKSKIAEKSASQSPLVKNAEKPGTKTKSSPKQTGKPASSKVSEASISKSKSTLQTQKAILAPKTNLTPKPTQSPLSAPVKAEKKVPARSEMKPKLPSDEEFNFSELFTPEMDLSFLSEKESEKKEAQPAKAVDADTTDKS